MPNRALNNIGLNTDWNLAEDGWKAGMEWNLLALDTLCQARALEVGRNSPPGSPSAGQVYVIGAAPTGAWSDHAHAIAVYDADAWTYIAPLEGWQIKSLDDGLPYEFDGSEWVELEVGAGVDALDGTVTIPPSSDSWSRADFENLVFSPAFPDGNYTVLFDYPNDAAAQSIGRVIAYDKAGNGCKVRATGSAGGTVRWVAIQLP